MLTYLMVLPNGGIRSVVRSLEELTDEDGAVAIQVSEYVEIHATDGRIPYYDFESKCVKYNIDIQRARDTHWENLKYQRDALEFGGFAYHENLYDSDITSQSRIMGATLSGTPQTWTTQDNDIVDLSAEDMRGLYGALQAHINAVHTAGRVAREKIALATTIEEVEEITL